MTNIGIICEYNPFHLGHSRQIEIIKEKFGSDVTLISLMSGNTVQRGELAIYPKFKRAEAAVKCGIDLVLELPCIYSCASAERFARGAVGLLDRLGNIDVLCFGSENGDIDRLTQIADNLSSDNFINALRSSDKTLSHAQSAEQVYHNMFGDGFPTSPNDILAVEYISALKRINSKITPFTYKRKSGYSASSSRKAITEKSDLQELIPQNAIDVFSETEQTSYCGYGFIAMNKILTSNEAELSVFSGMNGGVSGTLVNKAGSSKNFAELISSATCKSYPSSRLKRAVLSSVIGITDSDRSQIPLVTSLLAVAKKGCNYLSSIRKTSEIEIVTKTADYRMLGNDAKKQFELTLCADRIFCISRGEPADNIFTQSPFILC